MYHRIKRGTKVIGNVVICEETRNVADTRDLNDIVSSCAYSDLYAQNVSFS